MKQVKTALLQKYRKFPLAFFEFVFVTVTKEL